MNNTLLCAIRDKKSNYVALLLMLENIDNETLDEAIKLAVKSNSIDIVDLLVEKGAVINYDNIELVKLAVKSGNLEIVKRFIDGGLKVETDSYALLKIAIEHNQLTITDYLLSKVDDMDYINHPNVNHLMPLVEEMSVEMLEFLTEKGLDMTDENPRQWSSHVVSAVFKRAAETCDLKKLEWLRKNSPKRFNQFLDIMQENVIKFGTFECIKYLFDMGSKVNVDVCTKAFITAISENDIERASYLLSKGANINCEMIFSYGSDTALQFGIRCNKLEMVKFLIEQGVEICNTKDNKLIFNDGKLIIKQR